MTVSALPRTVSAVAETPRGGGVAPSPRVILAVEGEIPLLEPACMSLMAHDCVHVQRAGARELVSTAAGLVVGVADHEASRHHARLVRHGARWELVDLGSKNGTFVNGAVTSAHALRDRDVIELGGTVLVYRDVVADWDDVTAPEAALRAIPQALWTAHLGLARALGRLTRIAPSTVPVLIRGESGTGKELIAAAIHEMSGRSGAFVAINCGALPRALVESELFGYRRGAFSGAVEDRDGLVRKADGGTLFLDEIAELPEESQVALLRVLQSGEVRPVGSAETTTVDVRIVAATHQDLEGRIEANRFRQDLYARLSGFAIGLPTLRDRPEDLGHLAAKLLERCTNGARTLRLHRSARRALFTYPWPMNIRELEQALRAAVALADDDEIRLEHLPESVRTYVPPRPEPLGEDDCSVRDQLVQVLRENGGNVAAAARTFGKAPMQIRRWCHRFGVDPASFRR